MSTIRNRVHSGMRVAPCHSCVSLWPVSGHVVTPASRILRRFDPLTSGVAHSLAESIEFPAQIPSEANVGPAQDIAARQFFLAFWTVAVRRDSAVAVGGVVTSDASPLTVGQPAPLFAPITEASGELLLPVYGSRQEILDIGFEIDCTAHAGGRRVELCLDVGWSGVLCALCVLDCVFAFVDFLDLHVVNLRAEVISFASRKVHNSRTDNW